MKEKTIKKRKFRKYLWLLGSLAFVFIIGFLGVLTLKQFKVVKFGSPQTVSMNTIDSSSVIAIYGETPLGREIPFTKEGNTYHSGYGFLKNVFIEFSSNNYKTGDTLNWILGSKIQKVSLGEIYQGWEKPEKEGLKFYSNPDFYETISAYGLCLTIFHWTDIKLFLKVLGSLFVSILFIFIYLDIRWKLNSRSSRIRMTLLISGIISTGIFIYLYVIADKLHLTSGLFIIYSAYTASYFLIHFIFRFRKKLRQNLQLLYGILYFLWLFTEIILRFTTTRTYSEIRTGFYQSPYDAQVKTWYYTRNKNATLSLSAPEFQFERTTNSLGLCDAEPIIKKDSNEFRILALGDSFTEGDGAAADSTWVKLLERDLQKDCSGNKINCINAGVGGSDPCFEYVLLRDKLLVYKPDAVIVALGADLDDLIARGGMERFLPDGSVQYKPAPAWEWAYSLFFSMRYIVHNVLHYNKLLLSPSEYQKASILALSEMTQIIQSFIDLSHEKGFQLIIVIYPHVNELKSGKYIFWQAIIDKFQSDNQQIVDLLKYYRKEAGINQENYFGYYWPGDGHHNSKGYQEFSKGILSSHYIQCKQDSAVFENPQ